jgi:hypothetical protein
MEQSPLILVEVIKKSNNPGIIEAFITQPLSYMGPVLLLNMGIVILVVGSASRKGNRSCSFREVS